MDDYAPMPAIPKLPKLFLFLVMLGLVTSGLLLLIDLKIKNDLVMTAKQWEETINETVRRFLQTELGDNRNSNYNGDLRGDVHLDVPSGMETPNVSELFADQSGESGDSRPPAKPRPRARSTRIQSTDK